jgi:signal transduction histidine kinase
MQNDGHTFQMTIKQKLVLTYIGVSLVTVLLAEGLAWGGMALFWREPIAKPGLHVILVTIGAVCVGFGLSLWVSQPLTHSLQRIWEVSQAWLRGNLSLRIGGGPVADDLRGIVRNLDLLAEHLAQDEQDLVELRERNTRLTDQVRALAVVEERNRLARELHDSVKQYVFSMAMTASAIRTRFDALEHVPEDLAEMVREIETSAKTAQRETTRLIEDLRPGSLQERGLEATLNDYTLLFGAQEHLLVYLDVEGEDDLLPPSVAEALYRVAQEALHNVARHARASRVDVQLRCFPERVTLTIHDNGVGFDPDHVRRGLGLANMQDRMLGVGGRLTLEGQLGVGTTVLAEVALPHPTGQEARFASLAQYRPCPTIENWSWLGKNLVIPVGQTWPWLPADQVHLQKPLVEADTHPLTLKQVSAFLGLKHDYVLHQEGKRDPLVRIHQGNLGYEWEADGASWALRREQSSNGRMVLTRNRQPLAAIQYQGRQMHAWTEIIYNGRGYRLSYIKNRTCAYRLEDEAGAELLCVEPENLAKIKLQRTLPLHLIVMIIVRILDNWKRSGDVPGSGQGEMLT